MSFLYRFNTKQIFLGIVLAEAAAIFLLVSFVFSVLTGQTKSQALTDMEAMTRSVAQQVDKELNKVALSTKIISDAYMQAYNNLPEQFDDQLWRKRMHQTETSWGFFHDGQNRAETPFQSETLTSFVDRNTTFDQDVARQIAAADAVKYLIQGVYNNYRYSWVYISTEDDLVHIYPSVSLEYSSASTKPTSKHWYLAADFENRSYGWEEPYSDLGGQGQMVTVSYPFYDQNDQLKGVTSHDIKVQQLLDSFLKDIELYDNATIIVTSQYGKAISTNQQRYNDEIENRNKDSYKGVLYYIAPERLNELKLENPDFVNSSFVELNRLSDSVMHRLANNQDLSFELNIDPASDNELYQVSAVQIPATGWTIINAVPNASIVGTLDSINRQMQIAIAMILACLYAAIGFIYYSRLFVPIHKISSIAKAISGDNLDHKLPTRYSGEMGNLFKNFAHMIEQLKQSKALASRYHKELEEEVQARTEELHEKNKLLEKIAETDALTQLSNRNKLWRSLAEALDPTDQQKPETVTSVIMLDIDHFKEVNDTYGHNTGDMVLQEFAKILQNTCRETDIIGRWGGEEFLIICPNTQQDACLQLAETIRTRIESASFPQVGKVTASFGVGLCRINDSIDTVLERTDEALYQAKANGRNQVCSSDPERASEASPTA
ncbi:diguanylate cyclase [Oceanospirillum sanctuarii]|uniref:diguanylate cyclase n=1 Tax=Oceanospirillum sanctuarii TaxID=1434821 RepID=UPI001593D677|nr:diguanylate cyclase [Oceanospirillum sanctuarii]